MTTPNTETTQSPSENSQGLFGPLNPVTRAMLDDLDHGCDLFIQLQEERKAKQQIPEEPQK